MSNNPGALPVEIGQLGNFEARMLRTFRGAIEDWDEVCSALGVWESEHLTGENISQAKEEHRRWVSELLSWGRLVQRVTEQPEFPDRTLSERVNVRIRHLEDKLALWHRPMTTEQQERILQAAFK